MGLCGERGAGSISIDDTNRSHVIVELFVASEEALARERLEPLACLIELEMIVVGPEPGPQPCADPDGSLCEWAFEFELRSPRIVLDERGACAANELRYDAAWLERVHGARVALGYVGGYEGHGSVLMRYEPGSSQGWTVFALAFWDDHSDEFLYEARFGPCQY